MVQFAFVLLIAFNVFVTSACGHRRGPAAAQPEQRRIPDVPDYDVASCAFQPSEGDKALHENLDATEVTSEMAFQKKYDRKDLDAVVTASAVETVLYAKNLGLTLFRNPRPSRRGCPTYYVLDAAPPDLQQEWNKHAADGEGQLAGLYFENCTSDCAEWSVVNPTIMVNETADRWTLVHEMLHHNFNTQRKVLHEGRSPQNLTATLGARIRGINSLYEKVLAATATMSELKQVATDLQALSDDLYEILRMTSFEEMAVENLLLDEYVAGRLKRVQSQSLYNAVWYIAFSRRDGMRRFEALSELLESISIQATRRDWHEITRINDATQERIKAIGRQAAGIESEARKKAGIAEAMRKQQSLTGNFMEPETNWPILSPAEAFDLHYTEGAAALRAFDEAIGTLIERATIHRSDNL